MKKLFPSLLFLVILGNSFSQDRELYYELIDSAEKLYDAKNYHQSGLTYAQAFIALNNRGAISDRYNAACSWALAKEKDSAFIQLFKIAKNGNYQNYDHITSDKDLKILRTDNRWKEVTEIIRQNKEEAEKYLDKPLVKLLDSIYIEDQAGRQKLEETIEKYGRGSDEEKALWDEIHLKDSLNLIEVAKILDERGWLGPEVVGYRGNSTLFLVIQHSNQETQEKYLPMMREAVKNKKANGSSLALLEDRIALGKGEKQIYGSQIGYDKETDEHFVLPLIDPENVNERRKQVGLGSIEEYTKYFDFTWDLAKHMERHSKKE